MTRTESWPDLAGRLVGGGHVLPIRIYFEDTDFSGVVYHANYLCFMERGRSDMLRLLGVSHDALDDGALGERLAFAVHHIDVKFLKPARIDDLVEVETRVAKTAGARLVLDQTVRCRSVRLVEAKVTIVMINADGRARRLPPIVYDRLATLEAR
jgi:acyl-CoA thioester hydrolase